MELKKSDPSISLPFTFQGATCSDMFDHKALKAFLQERGLYDKGLWKHLCPKTKSKGLKFGTMCKDSNLFILSRESDILHSPISAISLDKPLENWLQYYRYRGFELESPISGLLHYPLTLYWIITNYLAKLYPESLQNIKQSGSVQVHVIGAEIEADMFPAFVECGHLLRPIKLNMHLFGDEISREVDGEHQSLHNLTFHLHSGLYHECHPQKLAMPDIVVGFNAGLSAYPSFKETIRQIASNETPFFCTDYCLESVIHSRKMLQEYTSCEVTEAKSNPFHSPFRIPASELKHLCFSNAFVFSVHKS